MKGARRMEYHGGTIEISDNVLREIAFRSVVEYMKLENNMKEQKRLRKIINVQRTPEDHIVVTLKNVAVPYGEKIPEYIRGLMKKVKDDLERMTEMRVETVNVQVDDVIEKEKMYQPTEEEETPEKEGEEES